MSIIKILFYLRYKGGFIYVYICYLIDPNFDVGDSQRHCRADLPLPGFEIGLVFGLFLGLFLGLFFGLFPFLLLFL